MQLEYMRLFAGDDRPEAGDQKIFSTAKCSGNGILQFF
jgi:hypothetical protein